MHGRVHDAKGRGAVFITGTSTGIGAATAIRLADLGFQVLAGVREMADGEALQRRTSGPLDPVLIEITNDGSIAAAAKSVAEVVGGQGLAALVNNAGQVMPGPLELQPLADFRMQLEVNLVGQLAVTQAFLPLIRQGHGRIVNVGSIGGRMVLPLHGAYSASKFGMEAISDALRIELRQWSIPVSLVDPGASATAIFGKTLAAIDELRRALDERGERAYDEQIAAVRVLVEKTAESAAPATDVAEAVADAVTSAKPKTRYLAGKGAHPAAVAARTLPDRLKDWVVAREADLPGPDDH